MVRSAKIQNIFLLTLFLLGFFGLRGVSGGKLEYIYLFSLVIPAYPAIKSKSPYSQLIRLYLLFVLISCIYSWKYNGQRLHTVIGRSSDYFALLLFFVLIKSKLTYKETESVLVRVALCFCFCYLIQWLIYPIVIFNGAADDLNVTAYQYRARMPGSICCYFLLMYAIYRYMLRRAIKYILFGIIAFFPIMIQGFRSLIALTLLASFLLIPFVQRSFKKTILFGILGLSVFLVALSTDIAQTKIEEMMERQNNDQTFGNEDYIRFLSLNYYWNEQFTKPYEKLFGGGNPVDEYSRYYNTIDAVKERFGYYWSDLGIVGASMIIGIPAVLLLVMMYIRCIWMCKEKELQYIRFTLLIVLLGSLFMTSELYREGNILLLSFFLYLEYIYHQEMKIS